VRHFAAPDFWTCFDALPANVQELARKNYEILKNNPSHPSLHFKEVGRFRSVRVGLRYRALGVQVQDGVLWFWIGTHSEYERLLG
jgi:hypothetical protein